MASGTAMKAAKSLRRDLSVVENPSEILIEQIESPIGRVVIASAGGVLCGLYFADEPKALIGHLKKRFGDFEVAESVSPSLFHARIQKYFAGDLSAFDGLPVDPGGTAFQRDVWATLLEIPVGTTTSYGELAKRIGRPAAVRAVGAANGSNPISLVIPCHRVIGSDGSLTGYGGGMDRKDWLLRHEGFSPRQLF